MRLYPQERRPPLEPPPAGTSTARRTSARPRERYKRRARRARPPRLSPSAPGPYRAARASRRARLDFRRRHLYLCRCRPRLWVSGFRRRPARTCGGWSWRSRRGPWPPFRVGRRGCAPRPAWWRVFWGRGDGLPLHAVEATRGRGDGVPGDFYTTSTPSTRRCIKTRPTNSTNETRPPIMSYQRLAHERQHE